MVDRVEPTVRYVAVDGPVSRIEPATDEQLVEMVKRYLPPERWTGTWSSRAASTARAWSST